MCDDGGEFLDRVDGLDLEPGHRLLEDQRRLPELLRREDGPAASGHGSTKLPQRFSRDPAPACLGPPPELEDPPDHFRELDERPVPRESADRVHSENIQRDDEGLMASVPGPNEALREAA